MYKSLPLTKPTSPQKKCLATFFALYAISSTSGMSLAKWVINYINRRDTLAGIGCQHLVQQIHEHLIAIQAIALELTEHARNVFEQLLLLYQYLLLVPLGYTEQSCSEDALAINGLHTAFQGHPYWTTGDDLEQDYPEGPHIEGPGPASLAQ